MLQAVSSTIIIILIPFLNRYSFGDSTIPGTVHTNSPPKLEQKLIVIEMLTYVNIDNKNTTISAPTGQISLSAISLAVSSFIFT